ncbi:hypothetical protein [Cohnella yongneupensis]|uniref:Uncharacterized protein n=1 Tax=Cohnella yongneupensis TaxID=425006 RepID=A0ABW0R688_9BACL
MKGHSSKAIWRAVESKHGARLVDIAREHIRLVKELPDQRAVVQTVAELDPHKDVREIIRARIAQLRDERDAIIQQFEEDNADG